MVAAKIEFGTLYDRIYGKKVRFQCDHGSRTKTEYEPVYDKRGVWHLEKVREKDIYMDIQAYADECDINVIMARYRNGETDVLSRIQGVYGDFSNIPTNYAEIMNQKLEAERLFMGLSADVREKYNNSVEQFMAEIGTKSGLEKLGVSFDTPVASEAVDPSKNVSGEVTTNE